MRTIILIALTLISSLVKGQDVEKSDFFKYFQRNFKLPAEILANPSHQNHHIFSIKLKTNGVGEIYSFSTSASMDSIFKRRMEDLYKGLDKKSLTSFGWKNTVLILPVYLFNRTPNNSIDYESMNLSEVWNFNDSNTLILKDSKLLPPLVVYYRKGKSIDN